MNKVKLLFNTSRPISWVNTAFPYAAAYIMLGGGVDARLIIGTIFFLIPYNLLMYGINDVFDYESDIQNPRKGGVEGAITSKKYHSLIIWSSLLVNVPFVAALIAMGSLLSSSILIVVMFFVVAYSAKYLRFKEKPFLDSITSSIHFVGPLVYACSIVGFNNTTTVVIAAFFCWGVASHALGAIQDIVPDRKASIGSIATVLGAKATIRFVIGMYVIATLLIQSFGGWVGVVLGVVGIMYIINCIVHINTTDKRSATVRRAWKNFLVLNYFAGAIITIVCIVVAK